MQKKKKHVMEKLKSLLELLKDKRKKKFTCIKELYK